MLTDVIGITCAIAAFVYATKRFNRWIEWNTTYYLYRIHCHEHQITLIESAEYPNKMAFVCAFCSWQDKDKLQIEQRAINQWGDWEVVE